MEASIPSLAIAYELEVRKILPGPVSHSCPRVSVSVTGHWMLLREGTMARALEPVCPARLQTRDFSGAWGQPGS